MGKPLSRPDCLRRNPSCLGKGEDEEGYIEDCYVPQRSIYDTMRINEQIDQGSKLNQPSRSTLGSGGGEGSTLSSNGTLGAGVGGAASVFESRQPEAGRKLDERVIFDALKLTGDSPAKPAPSLAPGSGSGSAASSGLVLGSGAVPGGVPKRRAGGGGGGGGKDNVNRRSWKAFMPPNYPEFAERMEISVGDYPGEKRLSGLMSPVLPHPLTPASLPLTPAPHSTPSSPGDFYSATPNYTPPQLPQQLQHAQRPPSQHQQHQHLHQHQKQQPILTAQSPLLPPVPARRSGKSIQIPQSLNQPPQAAASDSSTLNKAASKPPAASGRGREQTDGRAAAASKSEETDGGFPFLPAGSADSEGEGGEEGEATPLLSKAKVKPKVRVRAPPRATTWPRSLKAAGGGGGGRERLLVPRGEQGEDEEEEEEEEEEGEILLLAPPSPFLVGGLPLSPCLSRQGSPGAGGLLGRLQERTASELRFEEDERRILAELEQDEGEGDGEEGVTDQETQEERGWAAVLRLEPRSRDNPDFQEFQEFQDFHDNSLEYREWDAAGETDDGQALTSSPIWPLLAPPTGFGCEAEPQSPRSASEAGSEDLFLQLESQCLEEEEEAGEAVEAGPTQPVSPHPSPLLEHLSFAPTGLDEAHEKRVHPEDTAGNRSPASRDCSEGLLPLEGVSASAGELTDCSAERGETQTHPPSDLVVGGCEDPDSDFENTDDPPDPVQGDPFLVLEASRFPNYSPSCTPRNPYSDGGKETDSDFEEEGVGTGGGDPTSLPEGLTEETPKTATAEELDSPKQEVTEMDKDGRGEEEGGGEQVMKQEGAMPHWSQLPASRTPSEGVSQPHRTDSVCPDPPLTPTTLPNQTEPETEEGEEGCDGTAFVQTDSFVYLAVSAPLPSPTLPEPPSASQCDQYSQQDPPSSPGPKGGLEPECSFQSTDSFVYLAAPERLPCVSRDWEDNQERGAGEGLGSWEHRSDSSGSRQDVDFVLGSMSEDSDWESESEISEGSESCSDGWDYWDLLEPGLLRGLFPEVEELGKDSRTLEFRDSLPAGIPDGEERNSAGVSLVQGSALIQEVFQKEQVEPLQPRLQQANGAGQGLIQSAGKNSDTQGLEHELQETNARWNTLNKRVAERITHLQEALLHCGKFQDALEPLLSWLTDTEELIANQRPPSAEYKVVKAQIQEQKLLQRLLDDRRGTVEMIKAEGERIAQSAEPSDQEKIRKQLESLGESWRALLSKADTRQSQLEELLVLAKQFHETTEPLGEWLSATEKKLANSEPVGTQTSKINQQITQHKALSGEISGRSSLVDRAVSLGASLSPLSCPSDRARLSELLQGVQEGYREVRERACRKGALLEQALANARIFGEDEVEVLNWLAEVQDRLEGAAVRDFRQAVLHRDHSIQLTLNEEIVTRRKNVDQAVKNGQALLKQTTGEEVIVIQEKLDGIKTRYADITAASSRALRTLEQALQLSTRFSSTHQELCDWLSGVEEELNQSGGQSPSPEQIPRFHERQKELKNAATEQRLVLDTVNEVSSALLELVPWRAREGLDRLVSEANERFRSVSDIIAQRVQQIDAAIQRSQKYEQAADAELAWVSETERKLSALGPIRLQQDQTTAQIQVQKAFSIDIIRHKDSIDELLATREEILGTCGEEQKAGLQRKTDSLLRQYDAVSQLNLDRYAQLERAQVLVNQFWETHEELLPWLQETQTLLGQLPGPAVNHEALRQQQEEMRQLRESISEHKPHIDKLLKIGPQLEELNPGEGEMVRERYGEAGRCYTEIKEVVKRRATALDEAVSQSTQFHDKIEPMLETLEHLQSRLHQPPAIPAEVDKIREQLGDNKGLGLELEKLQPSFQALCSRGEELLARSQGPDKDPAAKEIRDRLDRLRFCWDDIRARAEEREGKLLDVLDLAEKFWYDMTALLSTIRDTQDIVKELEEPSIDPSLIKQQIEAAQAIKSETDGLREELEFVRILGADLIFACGETEKPEVKKTIDEMNSAWEGLNRTWKERMDQLEEAMAAAVQYQDALQGMFDYLDNAVIRLCDMSPVGTDVSTIKQQIEELKLYKVDVYQQQIDMERLNHQGELMLKKAMDDTDRVITQEPLTELRHLWDNLGEKIIHRQHKLEGALLALGQFQHALSELQSWLTHTTEMLDAQRPISTDPKAIEIELAKHHVLRNDVLSHRSTVDTVNKAGRELQESSAGDEASHLKQRLQRLNSSWEAVLLRTQERQGQLEAALQQAEGFHGEVEDFLQWLRRSESQLAASKPTGGLPETAREQLQQHMELQSQFAAREELYLSLLDKGHRMLLSREDPGAGSNTEQNLTLLEHKWEALRSKMEERKGKLEEALSLATGFQSSLQDFINWLTQAEQILNLAQPPSLLLDTVLFQIDEHKVFVNEVNTHRDQILALDKAGVQLKFSSQKQDVVLIKNLLLSMQGRWEKVVQRSLERGRALDEARKRAKQFHEAWRKLSDWLEEAEKQLNSELEISNDPDKIKLQLSQHKEFQKTLGGKQPVYDTMARSGRSMKEKASQPEDRQRLDNLLGEVRDKWDTVCGKSVERQHKLEEALLFSGQFADALQALVDWLYRVEPQLSEEQPVHGDVDLVSNLLDAHKVFQKELGKRTGSVQALKRSARELIDTARDDTTWVKVQLQELSTRWDSVCSLSVIKQTRLEQALKQAEEFRAAVQQLLEWLSEAEQTLRFRGLLPDERDMLQSLIDLHKEFMKNVEEKRVDVNKAAGMGEEILTVCHPDCITTIKHWITIIRARFEEVMTWAKQHQQRLETALAELVNNAELLDQLLSWLQWAETTLIQRDQEPLPQNIELVKERIAEHQSFMEEMTRKQPDVDKVTKTYKRKTAGPSSLSLAEKSRARKALPHSPSPLQLSAQSELKSPRVTQLSARWQQVWLLALDRQRKLNDALDRLEELKEFANFDFNVWRKKYMRWMNHKKSRVMDFFRRIDRDQDGKITRQEFIDGILASKFPTSKLEMMAVADIFDGDGDGYIDYYEFVAALHPNKDAYRPTTDADKIEDEVTRQVAQCKCAKRFQVEQIGENKYRFGDSQQLRLVRILRSTVMVRVGGGWMALDEFLVKNDPCRARGRTNLELREKFILPEGMSQGMAAFRSRGRKSKPSSRAASPTRSSSSASQSNHSCTSVPSSPATPASGSRTPHTYSRGYDKPWLVNSKSSTPGQFPSCPDHQSPSEVTSGSKLKRPTFHSSRGSLTGENGNQGTPTSAKSNRSESKRGASSVSRPSSRAGSRAGSRASSRRGSDASDFDLLETQSACSDVSETSASGATRRGGKPSKIPTISKKTTSPSSSSSTTSPKTPGNKR